MSVISISNKPLEFTDLEAHVVLCEQRRKATDDRIQRMESQFAEFEAQAKSNRKIILASLVSIATGVVSTIVAIFLKYQLL
jgi:hypothetical protein